MKKIWIIAAVAVFSASFCKKSAAGQKTQWESSLRDLDEATTQYPNLKALLNEKATAAKAIYAEAEKASGEEQKAEKIAAAIAKLRENLGVVVEIKQKLKNIDSTIGKITKVKTSTDRANRATAEIKAIRSEQARIESDFSALKPENSEDLNKQAREIVGRIISLSGRADRALKLVKGK
ncbi:MAG: hypothetical protein U1F27_13985 [Turneriella sp.]